MAPISVGAAIRARSDPRVCPPCGLPLGAIIQGGSLPARSCARARVRAVVCAYEQVQARADYFRCCRLLHTVF